MTGEDGRLAADSAVLRRRWALVLPHRDYLVRIAMHRGLPAADAEDCAHEAMVRCVEFEGLDDTRVLQFLAATTARLCVDKHRRSARDERASVRLRSWYADEPSPEEHVCDRAEAAWVATQADLLPESQRRALTSKAAGLACADVAATLGVSYKSVESLLSRARLQLRAAVASTLAAVVAATRRAPTAGQGIAGVSLASLATASILLATRPPAQARVEPSASPPGAAVALATRSPREALPAAPPAVAPAARVRPSADPTPAATRLPTAPPPVLSLPTPTWSEPPQPACERQPAPHVDPCLPLAEDPIAGYQPGENLKECMKYGVNTSNGFECNEPPADTREHTP